MKNYSPYPLESLRNHLFEASSPFRIFEIVKLFKIQYLFLNTAIYLFLIYLIFNCS